MRLLPPLLKRISTFTLPKSDEDRADGGPPAIGVAPQWVFPARSAVVSWDDLQGRVYLQWSGSSAKSYVLEYSAGSDPVAVSGRISVDGKEKDFGRFSRKYWNTWIVPYKKVTLRVREEPSGAWSQPLTVSLTE